MSFFDAWQDGETVRIARGEAPLLISLPHDGVEIPGDIANAMTDAARASPDTDWHVSSLYAFALELGATLLRPRYSRYTIDLNRPRDGQPLYPGRSETGLCPTVMFDGAPIYREGLEPSPADMSERIERYWLPYHNALAEELRRLRSLHANVVLWEGHSIISRCPMFFEGVLPDYNLGTASGASCDGTIAAAIVAQLQQRGCSHVANGRFKGGYITRHYGTPARGVHAVQMEMAQSRYLDERNPRVFDAVLAAPAVDDLKSFIAAVLREAAKLG